MGGVRKLGNGEMLSSGSPRQSCLGSLPEANAAEISMTTSLGHWLFGRWSNRMCNGRNGPLKTLHERTRSPGPNLRSPESLIACLVSGNAGRASQRGLGDAQPCAPGPMVDSSGQFGLLMRPLVGQPASRATFHGLLRGALICTIHAVITKYFTRRRAHVCASAWAAAAAIGSCGSMSGHR